MKKKLLVLILLPLFIFLFVNQSISTNIQDNNEVNIKILDKKIKTIIPGTSFVGVNWFDDNPVFRPLFTSKNNMSKLGEAFKKHNINLIRYPGGHNILTFFWDVNAENVQTALSKLSCEDVWVFHKKKLKNSDKLHYKDFLIFCRKYNIKATMQVNTQWYFDKNSNEMLPLKVYKRFPNGKKNRYSGKVDWQLVNKAAEYAAEQVKWTKDNGYLDTIKYWELGNEEYNAYHLGAGYTGEEYAKVSAIFIQKMKQVNTDIKFILTNAVVDPELVKNDTKWIRIQNDWTKKILKTPELLKYKDDIIALSNHNYPTGKTRKDKSFETFVDHVYNYKNLNINNLIRAHANISKNTKFANKDIFINEFNAHWFDSPNAHTWAAAMANSNFIMSCANTPECAHMDYHVLMHLNGCYSGTNENKGFGLFHFAKDFSIPIIPYPDATAISFLNSYLHGEILDTISDNEFVYTTASRKNNYVYVFVLNKKNEHTVSFDLAELPNTNYIENKTLGLGIPIDFTTMKLGAYCHNPEEIKLLNVLDNKLQVNKTGNGYKVNLPKDTLSVFVFKN